MDFLASEMKTFVAVVKDVDSVTSILDTSLIEVQDLQLIIIFVISYCYFLLWWVIGYIISKMKTIVGIMVTINYCFI